MSFTIRQHAGALLVAAGVVLASLFDGSFDPTAYSVASIAIWAAVLAGLLSRALPSAPVASPAAAAGLCLFGIVVVAGASVAWASDQGRAFEEAVRASAYLGLFALAACTASDRGRGEWVAGLTIGLGMVSVLAVASWLQPGLLENREIAAEISEAGSRLSFPIGYWNGLGALLAVAAVLLAYAGARAPDRILRAAAVALMPVPLVGIWFASSLGAVLAVAIGLAALILASTERPRQLLVALIGSAGGGVAIVAAARAQSLSDGLTDATGRSQGDWMSLILVVVVLACGGAAWLLDRTGWKPSLPRRAVLPLGGAAAVLAAVALVAADPPERFREFREPPPPSESRAFPGAGTSHTSGNGRWQLWGEAVDAFESAPVAGLGAGGYEDYWAQNATISFFARDAHSLPMQQLADLGLIGVALMLGFAAALVVAARRKLAGARSPDAAVLTAVIAAGSISAAIDWGWSIPAVFGPVMVSAGLLTASAPGRKPRRDGYALGLGAVATAWVAMIAGGLVVLGELKLEQSRNAAAEGRFDEAIDRALEARTVQPWSSEPYTQLALLEQGRGDFDEALRRLRQAQIRDSEDWRLALTEARLHAERGDRAGVGLAFERARALNPRAPYLGGG